MMPTARVTITWRAFGTTMQAVCLAGHWLDLWNHAEDEGCKILKGVKEAEPETPPQQASDNDAYPDVVDRGQDQLQAEEGLTPAKVGCRRVEGRGLLCFRSSFGTGGSCIHGTSIPGTISVQCHLKARYTHMPSVAFGDSLYSNVVPW